MSDSVPPADSVALNLIQFINNASVKMMRALSCVSTDSGVDTAATAWTAAVPPTTLLPSHQHHRRLPVHGAQRGAGRSSRASESPPLRLSAREAAADPYGGVTARRRRRRQCTPDESAIRRSVSAVGGGGRTTSTSSSSSSGSSDYSGGGVAYSSPRASDSPLLSGDDSVFDSLLVAGSIGAPASSDSPASGSYGQAAFGLFNTPSTTPPAGADRSGGFGSSCAQPAVLVDDLSDARYRLSKAVHTRSWAPRAVQPLSASSLPPHSACAQSNHFSGTRWHPMSSPPTFSCDFANGGTRGGFYYAGDEGHWPGTAAGASSSSWYATPDAVVAGFRNFANALPSQPPQMAAAVGCISSSVPLTSTCPDLLLPPSVASVPPESLPSSAASAAGWHPASDATAALDCAPSIGDMLDGLYDLLSDCATATSCAATRTCASAAPAAMQASLFAQCA